MRDLPDADKTWSTKGFVSCSTDCDSVSGTSQKTATTVAVLLSVSGTCHKKSLSTAAIVGIVVGSVLALVVIAIIVCAIGVSRKASWTSWTQRSRRVRRDDADGLYS